MAARVPSAGIAFLIDRRFFLATSKLPTGGAHDVRIARREPFDHRWETR
jgi:hypothetical protein